MSTKRVFEKRRASLCFCLLYVGESQTQKNREQKKGKLKHAQKIVLFGWVDKVGFANNKKMQNSICVWKWEKRHFRQHYLLWQNHPFLFFLETQKTPQKCGFQQADGKTPEFPIFFQTRCFWVWVSERLFALCDPKRCALLKTLLKCFPQSTACAERTGCALQNKPKSVGCVSTCKEVLV